MTITLPYPPSANRYWRHARGRTYRSDEAVDYINAVGKLCLVERVRPIVGDVQVSIVAYRPRKSGDVDNLLKVCLDALQGFAYLNDSQVRRITIERNDSDPKGARLEVEVEAC